MATKENVHAWGENFHVTIVVQVEIGMRDCLRNNDVYHYGSVEASAWINKIAVPTELNFSE